MATEDVGGIQRAEKVTLKRKLTGPPRLLLLGKTRTRSVGEDRHEANRDRVENTDSDAFELTGTANTDKEGSSVVTAENSGGRCGAAGEEDDRNWKTSRHKWWRRLLPAVLGNRKQKMDVKKGRRKQPSAGSVPLEGALQDTDADSLNNTEETTKHASRRKRGWTTFKRFLTSERQMNKLKKDFVEKDGDESSTTFRKKFSRFFTRGGNRRSSAVPLENVEDLPICEEASSAADVDKPIKLHRDDGRLEVVTADTSIQLMEEPAESPDETPTEEQPVCDVSVTKEDVTDAAVGSDTIQTDSEVTEGPKDTNKDSVKDLEEVLSSDCVLNADQLSALSRSSHHVSELHCEEATDQTPSQSFQPSTNGPSIRIELVPPDEDGEEDGEDDGEEERWGTPNHLLLLLGFEHSERQLVQTARSLVRAAMNAAVDQLTREQQSESDCVHREPPGCRDHA